MKLSDGARANGLSYKTAWRWWKQGQLPVPARQTPTGTIVVDVPERQDVGAVLDARVSAADQRADLDRQVARLAAFAAERGIRGATVVTEVGRGLNGPRKGLMAVLRAPAYGMIVVEHRDRLAGLARSPSRRR
jgi:putative resolvase